MKFNFRKILLALLVVLLLVVGVFVVWASNPLGPGEQAMAALEAGADVSVSGEKVIVFRPVNTEPTTGFIFYTGGRVDYRSYAPALRDIAAQGYLVLLVPAPLNLMVFDVNAADEIFPQFPEIEHWALGGHSLGGAMAANYLYTNPGVAEALILWASYPAGNNDLSASGLRVLSIYGTLDMAGMEAFEASRALLPPDTIWVVIEGGNHAQFGDYGPQPGDNAAAISSAEQRAQIVDATVSFLATLGE
ncbi:MAG: alpha/beta hydrolase [Anaerolineales bacterium]